MMRFIEDLRHRLGNMLIRAVITMVDEDRRLQEVQLSGLAGDVQDGVEHLLPYGFSMRVLPPDSDGKGAETVVLAIEPDLGMALPASDRRFRPTDLVAGEVVLHSDEDRDLSDDSQGHFRLHFKRGRLLEIHCNDAMVIATNNATVKAGNIARLEGDVVELIAKTKLKFDVGGYGEDWITDGSKWWIDTWKTGNVVAGSTNPITPPEHP